MDISETNKSKGIDICSFRPSFIDRFVAKSCFSQEHQDVPQGKPQDT